MAREYKVFAINSTYCTVNHSGPHPGMGNPICNLYAKGSSARERVGGGMEGCVFVCVCVWGGQHNT